MREYFGLLEMVYVLLWALDMLVYMGAKLYPMRHLRETYTALTVPLENVCCMVKVKLKGWGAKLSARAHCLHKPWARLQHCKHTHWGLRLQNDFP